MSYKHKVRTHIGENNYFFDGFQLIFLSFFVLFSSFFVLFFHFPFFFSFCVLLCSFFDSFFPFFIAFCYVHSCFPLFFICQIFNLSGSNSFCNICTIAAVFNHHKESGNFFISHQNSWNRIIFQKKKLFGK